MSRDAKLGEGVVRLSKPVVGATDLSNIFSEFMRFERVLDSSTISSAHSFARSSGKNRPFPDERKGPQDSPPSTSWRIVWLPQHIPSPTLTHVAEMDFVSNGVTQ